MAEAHQAFAALEDVSDEGLCPLGNADFPQHGQGRLRCAAVQRAFQRAKGAHDRRLQIRTGRSDDAGSKGRCVHAVVDHRVEVGVQRPGHGRGRPSARQHVEEVLGKTKPRIRLNDRFSSHRSPRCSDDDRGGPQERDIRLLSLETERIEGEPQYFDRLLPGCDRGFDQRSGMPGEGPARQPCAECLELLAVRKLAFPQQVDCFLEVCAGGQFLERESRQPQPARLPVNPAQPRAGGDYTLQPILDRVGHLSCSVRLV